MSPSAPPTPDGHSHNQPRPKMQNRRLSIVQDAEVDDLRDIDTHALDGKSPPPHHESSMLSYMESHSPNDESSHKCYPESPLISRQNSVVDEKEGEMGLKASRVEENGWSAFVSRTGFCFKGVWIDELA